MSLSERSASSGIGTGSPGHTPPPATAPTVMSSPANPSAPGIGHLPSARHCWIHTDHGEVAGLLVHWQAEPEGWMGRVVVADYRDATLTVNEFWVKAEHLRPAESEGRAPGSR